MRMVGSIGHRKKLKRNLADEIFFIELVIEVIFSSLNQVLSAYTSYKIIIFKNNQMTLKFLQRHL